MNARQPAARRFLPHLCGALIGLLVLLGAEDWDPRAAIHPLAQAADATADLPKLLSAAPRR